MRRTRVKVCGLTREADIDATIAAGADAVGFTVEVPVDTPREISVERAATLAARVPPFVTSVLVTMQTDPWRLAALTGRVDPDALQVHGELAAETLDALCDLGPKLVLAVQAGDTETARRYDRVADALLVDSAREGGAGGTGRTHDWTATRRLAEAVSSPVVLAGGLTPENVAEAVRQVEPFAVDVASGVEARGGEKDHDAVRAFVERATGALAPAR